MGWTYRSFHLEAGHGSVCRPVSEGPRLAGGAIIDLATERHEERCYVLLLPCRVRVVGLLTEGLAITNEGERQKGGSGKDESFSFLGTANRTSRLRSPVEPWGGFTMAARRMCAEWSDGKGVMHCTYKERAEVGAKVGRESGGTEGDFSRGWRVDVLWWEGCSGVEQRGKA